MRDIKRYSKLFIIFAIIFIVFSCSNAYALTAVDVNQVIITNTFVSNSDSTTSSTDTMTQFERGRLNSKVPTVDSSLKVYDYADLFTEEEEETLYTDIMKFIDEMDMDMAIVTISNNPERSAMVYADDFYDYNEFGRGSSNDGVLFLIDMDTREMWISTTGNTKYELEESEIEKVLDKTYAEITREKYFKCASQFIKYSKAYIKTDSGIVFSPTYDKSQLAAGGITGAICSIIYFIIGHGKHKLIKKAYGARDYANKLNLSVNSNMLLHHRRHRIYSPPSSSSGGSFGGGGSSIHVGSSGISHGGGGRHF